MAKWKSLNLQRKRDDAEARKVCWSFQCDLKYRHHIEPRGPLYGPKQEAFPVPLKYDVTTYRDFDKYRSGRSTRQTCW